MMYQNAPAMGKTQHEIMAEMLMQRAMQPQAVGGSSPMEGVAAALGSIGNAFMARKAMKKAETQKAFDQKQLADALQTMQGSPAGVDPATGIDWKTATPPDKNAALAMLLQNERNAPIGMEMLMGDMKAKQGLENEIAKTKALMPFEIDLARAKAAASMSGSPPAAIAIANEIQKARKAGDTQRVNDLLLSAKMLEKGVILGPDGSAMNMAGYVPAIAEQAGGKQDAQNQSDLIYKPLIEEKSKAASEVGKDRGEKEVALKQSEAQLPNLERVVGELSDLGKKATYTYGGQAVDFAARQSGLQVPEGAVARTEYISKVDNEILPLLRQTFGAQFTEREGQSLKATLGDPNKSPEEKDAVLRSFISQKRAQIGVLKNQVSGSGEATQPPKRLKYNPATGGLE